MSQSMQTFLEKCTVVLSAGGEGSRFRAVTGPKGVQKAAYELPSGDSLIERTIKIYRDFGLTNFVVLIYHEADSVKKVLGDGSKLGVSISYSEDPGQPVGRGGAMKHAFMQGVIPKDHYLIVHNPDDQLVGDTNKILEDIISDHIAQEAKGALASAIMVEGTNYEFSGFTVEDGFVTGSEMYPFVKIPTHIGMTVFSPNVYTYFEEMFDLSKKTDFEAVVFPLFTEEKKLASHFIPTDSWISVNDEKGLKKLLKTIGA